MAAPTAKMASAVRGSSHMNMIVSKVSCSVPHARAFGRDRHALKTRRSRAKGVTPGSLAVAGRAEA